MALVAAFDTYAYAKSFDGSILKNIPLLTTTYNIIRDVIVRIVYKFNRFIFNA